MFLKILKGDLNKNISITILTIAFVAIASALVSLVAILAVNLFGSIDALMIKAKTPHFLQMHSGELDYNRLASFAKNNENIELFQVLSFLNIEGAKITIGENSFSSSVQDNGLCIQSDSFDYLLDLDGNIINPTDGEIYAPISYMKDNSAKLGDIAVICGKEFTVAGFLRDSQMNSLLSSSKRFLVSNTDFESLKSLGEMEYLIEFRLKSLDTLSAFTNEYSAAGLESNGPTITYPLFRMINAISDGMMIAVILLVSLLVVTIAFMCIRFTLLAKIEDETREIGVMKAIGLRVSDIRAIYLVKYNAISAIGCILGCFSSFILKEKLLENIRLYMGESENTALAGFLGLFGMVLVFLAIIVYVWLVMKRFKKISAAEALRFGAAQEKTKSGKLFHLQNYSSLNVNVFYGLKDVFVRKKLYITMLIVFVLSAFIILVPHNLYNTISSNDFITYMGVGQCDISINIQQVDDISGKASQIMNQLENDEAIEKCVNLTTKTFTALSDDGTKFRLKVELGDHGILPVSYVSGHPPLTDNEIALSALNSDELQKKVGDILTFVIDETEKKLTVCGIYSDITNGGKTAKANFMDSSKDIMWSAIFATLSDSNLIESKVSEYTKNYPFSKVMSVRSYADQTIGATISMVKIASQASVAVALFITALITVLFMIMLISKDRHDIAVLHALGFNKWDLGLQYVSRAAFVLLLGIIIGTILANTIGESLAGAIISTLGATSFRFVINPLTSYCIYPILMVCAALIATMIGISGIDKIKISENIKE